MDNELRKLRFCNICEQNRLERVTQPLDTDPLENNSAKELCGQLRMENDLYYEALDKSEAANIDMRKTTAKNIVMISHVSMKLHFIKEDVYRKQEEEEVLRKKTV